MNVSSSLHPGYTALDNPSFRWEQEEVMNYNSAYSDGRTSTYAGPESTVDAEWSPDLDPDDLRELQAAKVDPSKLVAQLPKESARMGYFSAVCLIINRMIGVGIFTSQGAVFLNTQSIGLSLIFWMLGGIMCICGGIVFVELGLTVPRWPFGHDGRKVSAIRSGDGLNHLNYMLKKPLFLATCMYGITFIIQEQTAANSVSFATNILDSALITSTPGKVVGLAVAANTVCCLLHALSRKWGILLNNGFATVKLLILVFLIICGFIWVKHDVASDNLNRKTSFDFSNSPTSPYRYAEAFLFVVLPYGNGCHQINYVISELREPRKIFPRATIIGILLVTSLYMTINTLFAAIVPKAILFQPGGVDVGKEYFARTLGHVIPNPNQQKQVFAVLKAISAFGNLIVISFTTARVKQEIAKEGVLPYSLFFAENYGVSFSSCFGRGSNKASESTRSFDHEKTPVATLALHWVMTTIFTVAPVLAIQPVPYSTTAAYGYLQTAFVYNTDVVYFVAVAGGLLCLRFTPSVRWAEKSQFKHPWISKGAAIFFFTAALFPVICIWIPDPKFPYATRTSNIVPWWAGQTLAVCLLAFSFLYWVAFRLYIRIRSEREGKTLHVKREPIFKQDTSGGLIQIFEIVTLQWRRDVGMRLDEIDATDDGYPPSTLPSSSPPPNGSSRSRQYEDWEIRSGSGLSPLSAHEIGPQQRRHQVRRKPVMSEMA